MIFKVGTSKKLTGQVFSNYYIRISCFDGSLKHFDGRSKRYSVWISDNSILSRKPQQIMAIKLQAVPLADWGDIKWVFKKYPHFSLKVLVSTNESWNIWLFRCKVLLYNKLLEQFIFCNHILSSSTKQFSFVPLSYLNWEYVIDGFLGMFEMHFHFILKSVPDAEFPLYRSIKSS